MIDSVPIAFGNDQEIFHDHGLQVEPKVFAQISARNPNLLSGSVDGALIDISAVVQLLANDGTVRITSTAYESVDQRRYALIVQPWANVDDVSELVDRIGSSNQRNERIGLTTRTDIEFATDRLIESTDTSVEPAELYGQWNSMLDLAQAIGAGGWLAGSLPEPAGSYMEIITKSDSTPVQTLSNFDNLDLSPSVFIFQDDLIQSSPEVIEAFYGGYESAISEMATMDREQVIDIALGAALRFLFPSLDKDELPPASEEFFANYLIPTYPTPRPLTAEEYGHVADWNVDKGYVNASPSFDVAVTEAFNEVLSQQS